MKPRTKTLTLPQQIADNIADAIISGVYPPGTWLAEQELAGLFEVSRGPVRDALRILEQEGLIRIYPRRGTQVTRLSQNEVDEIFQIRAALMGLAAQLASVHASDLSREKLNQSITRIEGLATRADGHEFVGYASEVSMLVGQLSGSQRLHRLLLSMSRQTLALTRMALEDESNRVKWGRNWRALARAMIKADPEAAASSAHRLVSDAGKWAREFAIEPPRKQPHAVEQERTALRA